MKRRIQCLLILTLLTFTSFCYFSINTVDYMQKNQTTLIISADEEAPIIQLVSPENESIVRPFSWIDIDVEDEVAVSTVLYHWDAIANETFEEPYDLMARTSEVNHTLFVYANDTSNNWASAVFVFLSDGTIPEINLDYPFNDSIYLSGQIINATVTDLHLDSVLYSWDNALNNTWSPPFSTSLITGDGVHSFTIYANDSAGNWAKQQYVFITDDLQPLISLESPNNGSLRQSGSEVVVEINDASLESVLYAWDSDLVNITGNQSPITTFIPSGETFHFLSVYANDSLGRWSSAIFAFEADNTPPSIDMVSPANGTLVHSGITPSLSFNDTSGAIAVFYSWNGNENESWLSPIPAGDGIQILEVFAYDLADNMGYAKYIFEVDDSSPILTHPDDITVNLNQGFVNITWNLIDANPSHYFIYHNGTLIENGDWISGEDIVLPLDTSSVGWSNYTIVVTDVLGNSAIDIVLVQVRETEVSDNNNMTGLIIASAVVLIIVGSLIVIVYIFRKKNIGLKK